MRIMIVASHSLHDWYVSRRFTVISLWVDCDPYAVCSLLCTSLMYCVSRMIIERTRSRRSIETEYKQDVEPTLARREGHTLPSHHHLRTSDPLPLSILYLPTNCTYFTQLISYHITYLPASLPISQSTPTFQTSRNALSVRVCHAAPGVSQHFRGD